MAEKSSTSTRSRSKRDKEQAADSGAGQNGGKEAATYEQELAAYLQQRIKPGLNSGAIPLLARSIAKDIAQRERPAGESKDADEKNETSADAEEKPTAEAEEEPTAEAADEPSDDASEDEQSDGAAEDESDEESAGQEQSPDFEADMHDLQSELGEDWVLSFSVQGDDAWLTAEKSDGSQRLQAPTAAVLSEAVQLLNEGGR